VPPIPVGIAPLSDGLETRGYVPPPRPLPSVRQTTL